MSYADEKGRRECGSGTSSGEIQIDQEVYEELVKGIEDQAELIISTNQAYSEVDAFTSNNVTVPKYEEEDHNMVDLLKQLKEQVFMITETMNNIKENYLNVDEESKRTAQTESVRMTGQTIA